MQEGAIFLPERKSGLMFHLGILLCLAGVAGWGIWQTVRPTSVSIASIAPMVILFSLCLMLLFAYRLYVLLTASYHIENEEVRLRWGWRQIAIPMEHILGVQLHRSLGMRPRVPRMRWPGNVVGVRKVEALGEIEFLATNIRNLVFIVTERKAYAISPEDVEAFLRTFQHFAEMGAPASLEAHTRSAPNGFTQLWEDKIARALACAMFLASALYFAWVEWALVRPQNADMGMQTSVPSGQAAYIMQWRLLAWFNALILVVNFLLGVVAWQKMERRVYTYLIWGIGLVTVVLFYYGSIVQIK